MNLFTSTFFNSGTNNYPDATVVEVDSTYSGMGSFTLTQNNYDIITVDWGDGNSETFEGTYSDQGFSHFYDESKNYIIQIQGDSIDSISFSYEGGPIRAIKCGSSLTSHENMFYECGNLEKVEETFKIGEASESQNRMFAWCGNLSEITHNIFPESLGNFTAVEMFAYSGVERVSNLILPSTFHNSQWRKFA